MSTTESGVQKREHIRQKLTRHGAASLSDFELLQVLMGRYAAASKVLTAARDLHKLLRWHGTAISHDQMQAIDAVDDTQAAEILAAFELGRRYQVKAESPLIDTAEKAVAQLQDLRQKSREYFVCLTLDGANRLIAKREITAGTLTPQLIQPREVFADAIADRAVSVIVAHNHPSGSLNPSAADYGVTERLTSAAQLLGLTLADHLIVTKTAHTSMMQLS